MRDVKIQMTWGSLILWVFISGINSQLIIGDVEYGYPCKPRDDSSTDPAELCNLSKNLECLATNVCGCQSHMYLDPLLGKCIVYEGESCLENVNNGSFPQHCTPNARCDQPAQNVPGICRCLTPEYIPTQNRFCKLSHQSVGCSEKSDCSLDAFLTCNTLNSTCVCDQSSTMWNSTLLQCVGTSAGICDDQRVCMTGAECQSGRCQCKFPEYLNYQGKCYLTFDQTCLQSADCIGDLQCLSTEDPNVQDKKCNCPSYAYLYGANICNLKHGNDDSCEENYEYPDRFSQCVDCATCSLVQNSNGFYWRCRCDEGHTPTVLKECFATLGTACANTTECNSEEGLVCGEGNVCTCPEGQEFAFNRCRTVKLIGENCMSSEDCIGASNCEFGSDSNWRCACPYGATASPDKRECILGYRESCRLNQTDPRYMSCNSALFLECNPNSYSCECERSEGIKENYPYYDVPYPCVALGNSPCYVNYNNRTLNCDTHSTCSDVANGRGTCNCDTGYSFNSNSKECTNGSESIKLVFGSWIVMLLASFSLKFL